MYQISMKQILVSRTWIVRECNPVQVHKLTDVDTSLLLCNLDEESMEREMYLESLNNFKLE